MSEPGLFDADNYHKLNQPFESADDANAALEAFWEEFYALRNKYKIPDVLVVFRLMCRTKDGDVAELFGSLNAGSEMYAESLAAWGYGRESAQRQERMARIISQVRNDSGGINKLHRKRK